MNVKKILIIFGSVLLGVGAIAGIIVLVTKKPADTPQEELDWIIPGSVEMQATEQYIIEDIPQETVDAEGIATYDPSQTRDNYGREIPDLSNTKTPEEISADYQSYISNLPTISQIDWTYSKTMDYPSEDEDPYMVFYSVADEWGCNVDPLVSATPNTSPIPLDFSDADYEYSAEPFTYNPGYGRDYKVQYVYNFEDSTLYLYIYTED